MYSQYQKAIPFKRSTSSCGAIRVFGVMFALVANRCATCQDDEEAGTGLGMGRGEVKFDKYKLNQIDKH